MLIRLLVALVLALPTTGYAARLAIGDAPPDFLGVDVKGGEVRVSEHRGKVVVVSFWATWCPPCIQELPVLDKLQRAAGDRIKVVAVNFKEPTRAFAQIRDGLGAIALLTLTHDRKGLISRRYGVRALPHLFMIDHHGRIAHMHIGYGEQALDQYLAEINALLAAAATAEPAGPATGSH